MVKLIKDNDEGLLKFTEDIPTVPEVSGQMVDSLFGDLKQLSKELEEIQKTADVEADRLKDENGKFINYSRKKTLTELQSQKTSVHKNEEGVEQFNLMESEEEVTEMQFFAMNAEKTMDESYATAEEMKSNYLALLRYFGEDEKMPSGDFFATLNRFLESFDSALDAVNKAEQARVGIFVKCEEKSSVMPAILFTCFWCKTQRNLFTLLSKITTLRSRRRSDKRQRR